MGRGPDMLRGRPKRASDAQPQSNPPQAVATGSVTQARSADIQGPFCQALDRRGATGPASAPNRTGLPDGLKANLEAMSGLVMDDVRVHRNSAKPAQLRAHAYAQGSQIHLGPGQERQLPHEAWHVVQQKQRRVKPTLQMKGVAINAEGALEKEADAMGRKAEQAPLPGDRTPGRNATVQPKAAAPVARRALPDSPAHHSPANDLVKLTLAPAAPGIDPHMVVQGDFAVEVSIAEDDAKKRVVQKVVFGERPATQFGSSQQDHVVAWTLKCNQIRDKIVGHSLDDAIKNFLMIVGDSANVLQDDAITGIANEIGQQFQNVKDDLDRQQLLQTAIKEFLVAYNKNPRVTQKRIGKADKTEGARVKPKTTCIQNIKKSDRGERQHRRSTNLSRICWTRSVGITRSRRAGPH